MFSMIGVSMIAEQQSWLELNGQTMLWTVISFVLLLVVLGKFAWKPLLSGLEAREKGIRDSIESAERLKAEAESILAEHKRKVEEASSEVKQILDDGRERANEMKEKIISEARASAQSTVDRATREIEVAEQQALDAIRAEAVDLSIALASKVLGRTLDKSDHEELIRESMKELEL